MGKLLFLVAGVPLSAEKQDTIHGLKRIKEMDLDGMELEFVNGVKMQEKMAYQVQETKTQYQLTLTAHAPYFINLNSKEINKLENSRQHILRTAHILSLCGGMSFTFHPAYYLKDPPQMVYQKVKEEILLLQSHLQEAGISILISPETTGKPTAFGSLEELLSLCQEISGLNLCVDFAHLHARTNGLFNSYEEFCSVLEKIKQTNPSLLQNMHLHVSGILYNAKGEIKHLPFLESDFRYQELLQALKDYEVSGVLVCESPILEKDTLLLKETYEKLRKT